jgi:hypothetical protein
MKVSEPNLTPNHYRSFKLTSKADGHPAVEVESEGQKKQFVRVPLGFQDLELTLFSWVVSDYGPKCKKLRNSVSTRKSSM